MEQKSYTVDEVINLVINTLSGIRVPIGLYDSVGTPIRKSINNLQVCLQMMAEETKLNETGANAETEEVIENVRNTDA